MVQAAETRESLVASSAIRESGEWPIVVRLPADWPLTDECLIEIGSLNDPLHFERSAEGALEIALPAGSLSGERSGEVYGHVWLWTRNSDVGRVFPPSSGFRLPNSAVREPDTAWVSDERLEGIETDAEGFWPVCPDFVVEVRSRGQSVAMQQEKMQEWMSNGARLGWLIDPYGDQLFIYRADQDEPERLEHPETLSGEDVAEGLTVELAKVWR